MRTKSNPNQNLVRVKKYSRMVEGIPLKIGLKNDANGVDTCLPFGGGMSSKEALHSR